MELYTLSELRQYALERLGFETTINSEFVDETMFLGHRLTLSGSSLENMTKLSTVLPQREDLQPGLLKLVKVCELLEGAHMESEIIFSNQASKAFLIDNVTLDVTPPVNTLEELQRIMTMQGWSYTDHIYMAASTKKAFRKYAFSRLDWHGRDLMYPVEFFFTNPTIQEDDAFLQKAAAIAEAARSTWVNMPAQVPNQNMFGQIQVDKTATEYAFRDGITSGPRFNLEQ